MDLRNIPYRSEVITWNPDDLAEYFKTVSLTVFHLHITKEQITNMSENDIQKFPKLRVPLIANIRQMISKKEECSNIKINEGCCDSFKDFTHKCSFDSSYTMAEVFKHYCKVRFNCSLLHY
uniref:SAM domain-containing protein n=1 Tax=Pavo cristatus TaxID=9049 RepID=A0A8C9FAP3_PAVCR